MVNLQHRCPDKKIGTGGCNSYNWGKYSEVEDNGEEHGEESRQDNA